MFNFRHSFSVNELEPAPSYSRLESVVVATDLTPQTYHNSVENRIEQRWDVKLRELSVQVHPYMTMTELVIVPSARLKKIGWDLYFSHNSPGWKRLCYIGLWFRTFPLGRLARNPTT